MMHTNITQTMTIFTGGLTEGLTMMVSQIASIHLLKWQKKHVVIDIWGCKVT